MKTILTGLFGVLLATAQQPPPYPEAPPPADAQNQPPAQLLTPDQLDNLVAPIALYPDSLLSQVLVAATYPIEVVEAQQWLQQNRNLPSQQLVDAARDQNWDPSVQALVTFPDVVARLNQDIRWTTDLGNAFLAQQSDVMNAVQRMRQRAQENGKLQSNAQETVNTETQDGQTAIDIQPADPQTIYVPVYDPAYIWGPPVYGIYPPLYYPPFSAGFGFGTGIYIGGVFGGCCGWGAFGWGWAPHWFDHHIVVNNYFLHRYGFRDFHGGEFRDHDVWAHDPGHRLGVPYPNRALQGQFRGAAGGRDSGGGRNFNAARSPGARPEGRVVAPPPPRFGSPEFEHQNPGGNRSAFGGVENGGRARIQSDHGFSAMRPSPAMRAPQTRAPSMPRGGSPRGGSPRGGRGH
ncbi:MAG: DUF3300 domain-containing protein [Acidobacteriia bacterium]|nr:DUF3300 domain-containing protein [Terriglobia bacterium]